MLGPFQIALYRLADPSTTAKLSSSTPRAPFPVTFETVFAELEALPRMYIELDGSFVWVGEGADTNEAIQRWQLDGHLYDRDDRLLYLELSGTCPRSALESILAACQITPEETLCEWRREGTLQRGRDFLAS